MVTIESIKNYGNKLIQEIPELKKFILVVDDSQLISEMKDITDSDNLILAGFIPSHKAEGSNVDDVQNRDFTMWMVLNKVDRTQSNAEFIESFKKCQKAALDIEKKMIEDKPSFGSQCTLMRQLQLATIKIDPIWMFAGCDGYEIYYELLTPIY